MSFLLLVFLILSLLFFFISSNSKSDFVKFLLLTIMLTFIIKISSYNDLSIFKFEITHQNIVSSFLLIIFSLIFYNKIKEIIHTSFLAILLILSINYVLYFLVFLELYLFSFFILNKKTNFSIKFVNFNYVVSLISSVSVLLFYLYNNDFFILIFIILLLSRFVIISSFLTFKKYDPSMYFYLICFQIIISNFISKFVFLFNNNTIKFLIIGFLLIYILINTLSYIKNKTYENYFVLNIFLSLSLIITIFNIINNIIILSFLISFILFLVSNYKNIQILFHVLLIPVPFSPIFYYEIKVLNSFSKNLTLSYLLLLFIVFYKIKNFEFIKNFIYKKIRGISI